MLIHEILKDTSYGVTIFSDDEINAVENMVIRRQDKLDTAKYYIKCQIRGKEILAKPEEIIRQLYIYRLIKTYKYEKKRFRLEHPVHFGRQVKRADIVIFDQDHPTVEYIIIEVKKPLETDGKKQLFSYCHSTGAPIGVWLNGGQISYYNRIDPNFLEDLTDIPRSDQCIEDIKDQRFTYKDLIIKDKVINQNKDLKQIIKDLENDVLANAGVDVFEEVFKLIFIKLYDEALSKEDKKKIYWYLESQLSMEEMGDYKLIQKKLLEYDDNGKFRNLVFRNNSQAASKLKDKIQTLFDDAKEKWKGVFSKDSKIELSASHLAICVSSLQDVKLFNSNLLVIDEAFEYLINKSAKGDKGQYFTPRHVIDMCVKMLNPKAGEYMIDTASGSCGFPVHTIFHITKHLFVNEDIPEEQKQNILKIFGIDFDERAVRVSRTLNLIAGDGETNVLHMNTLDYDRWDDNYVNNKVWMGMYGSGFDRLEKLRSGKGYDKYNFDILMANPPFAGDIKESRLIHKYDLGFNEKSGKPENSVGRDILFIERNLNFIKDGGRMAIVLPQGRFNNLSDLRLRNYIADKARILAVVGLHVNTFKPHTGTKTSVLFLQKWNEDRESDYYCPRKQDYPIFFATSEKPGKNNSGEYIYLKVNGVDKLDRNGHRIVDHDLHNHNGELPDGIAEAFIKFVKDENLHFGKEV